MCDLLTLDILYIYVERLTRFFPHSKPAAERWRHIYSCYKKKLVTSYGFTELCFDCSEWIVGKDEWNDHYEIHLGRPEILPIQCNPFVYGGTLACPRYCPFCMGNTALSAPMRMQQFLDQGKWKAHLDGHIKLLDGCKATKCTHPRPKYVDAFPSVLELKFHLQDIHYIEFTKGIKRRRSGSEVEFEPNRRKRSRRTKDHDLDVKLETWPQFTYKFVDETTKLYGQQYAGTSTPPSISSEHSSPSTTSATDESTGVAETPASTVCSDLFDKLDPRLHDE